jgi:hypothetical protein
MTPAELTLTAAFGASALTGLASLGVIWVQEARRRRARDKAALHTAMLELLSRSMAVAMRGQVMGETMKVRSGLVEGLDVAMHNRKPVDPLELHDWMAQDIVPLNAALGEIWTRCDQEGVRLSNDVVGKCMDLLGASTALQPAQSRRERARKWATGEHWTPEMRAAHEHAMKDLAHARKRFADYARSRLGQQAVDLFAQVEIPGEHEKPDRAGIGAAPHEEKPTLEQAAPSADGKAQAGN